MVIAATVDETTGLELTARMLQSPKGELPADAASGALSEILNMVAGRIQNGLTSHGLRSHIGLPATSNASEPAEEAILFGFAFESLEGELRTFAVWVSEQEGTAGSENPGSENPGSQN